MPPHRSTGAPAAGRLADRRLDERGRAAVDQLARALILNAARTHPDLRRSAAIDETDPAFDRAAAVLLHDREAASRLRLAADLHHASVRLRARAAADADHADHFTPIDPLDGLAADAAQEIADAAARVRAEEAQAVDPFGEAAPSAADARALAGVSLAALAAVLRQDLEDGERHEFDRLAGAALQQLKAPEPGADGAVLLAQALAACDRLTTSLLLDLLEAGHVAVFTAGLGHKLARTAAQIAQACRHEAVPPAIARHLQLTPFDAARLLLLLSRARTGDEDRAGERASGWLEVYAELSADDADALLDEHLRDPLYARAIARAEALA